ncbi:MAG: hypothetical protein RI516_08200, partial [Spiribacter sp.]|nr:hypothetical protein [Spiribacter sp.]
FSRNAREKRAWRSFKPNARAINACAAVSVRGVAGAVRGGAVRIDPRLLAGADRKISYLNISDVLDIL